VSAAQENVLRLQVPVHHSPLVGARQGIGQIAQDSGRVWKRESVVPRNPVAQRLTLDVRHDIVELAVRLARVVETDNVRVGHPGCDPDLVEKPLGSRRSETLIEDLHRHRPVVPRVVSQVHRGHPAATQFADDGVPSGQRRRSASLGPGGVPSELIFGCTTRCSGDH
jgi:hypothetical protein